jgi:hypothetical protein
MTQISTKRWPENILKCAGLLDLLRGTDSGLTRI